MSYFYEVNGDFKIISETKRGRDILILLQENANNEFIQKRQPKESVQLFAGDAI